MGRKYYSEIAEGIHESARDLFEIGAISEARMRDFDRRCFVEEPEVDTASEFFGAGAEPLEMERVTA